MKLHNNLMSLYIHILNPVTGLDEGCNIALQLHANQSL